MNSAQIDFFTTLKPYMDRLYRSIWYIIRNEADSQDIFQETMVRALENFHRFDQERPFYPWILTIARNLARNLYRKKTSQEASIPDHAEFESEYSTPEESVLKQEHLGELDSALQKLKPEQREIIELKHFQDCSYNEIAEILGIAEGTVMSRLYYARKRLSEILEDSDR